VVENTVLGDPLLVGYLYLPKEVKMKKNLTRRDVLTKIALFGGSASLIQAMGILGIGQIASPAFAGIPYDPIASSDVGKGKKVAIIGAGLSGLTAAYELSLQGFECRIFEADNRPKGRTFTVRPDGSPDSWYQESGRDAEVCNFNEIDGKGSLYFEAGAGRIPTHHTTVLEYCKKFDVKLESFIFASRENLLRSDSFNKGQPVSVRHFKHNLRAYLAEIFRTAHPACLESEMTQEDLDKLSSVGLNKFSEAFGDLDQCGNYTNRSRAGYKVPPGAGNTKGEYYEPFVFEDMLKADTIWSDQLFNDMRHYWQTSLMQPVGGIDKIAEAFMRQATPSGARIGNLIRLSRKVVNIKVSDDKVLLKLQHVNHLGRPLNKRTESFEADYCISTIAPSLLNKIRNNFSSKFSTALKDGVSNVDACKVAWQSDRFWESPKNGIYGGISWTSDDISQIWYPSTGFHNKRGILTGAYIRGGNAATFGKLSHKERVNKAIVEGRKLHKELDPTTREGLNADGKPYNAVNKAMTIAWQNMPFQDGGWFSYTDEQRNNGYQTMLKGQKDRFFMAGDAMSYVSGWMEGALTAGVRAKDQVITNILQRGNVKAG